MKACFWWDSKSQHLFGWGSEKSSVSPCSARGNAIPGCMGFYEKQLYVEKGRWREPEKERQHGKEGDREREKDGGRQKDREEEGESGKRWSYGGWNYEEWRLNDKVQCLMRNTNSEMRAQRKWKPVFYMTFSPLHTCSRPLKRWSVFIIIEFKKRPTHTSHTYRGFLSLLSIWARPAVLWLAAPGLLTCQSDGWTPSPLQGQQTAGRHVLLLSTFETGTCASLCFLNMQAVKLQTYEGVLTDCLSNPVDI